LIYFIENIRDKTNFTIIILQTDVVASYVAIATY